jgi:hypothetical protein
MRRFLSALVLLGLAAGSTLAAELTELEQRWLTGIWPVVMHARDLRLPLDIVVQPQPTPGLTPLGMAFVDGRCKLVLSMRSNPKAQAMLDRIDPALLDSTLELMAAHELGHCHRHLQASFDALPAGFTAIQPPPTLEPELRAAYLAMKATRREEGFSDLVGLAWTKQRHPALYATLHAWLLAERSRDVIRGSDHDTRAWLHLVHDSVLLTDASIFNGAMAAWERGLDAEE